MTTNANSLLDTAALNEDTITAILSRLPSTKREHLGYRVRERYRQRRNTLQLEKTKSGSLVKPETTIDNGEYSSEGSDSSLSLSRSNTETLESDSDASSKDLSPGRGDLSTPRYTNTSISLMTGDNRQRFRNLSSNASTTIFDSKEWREATSYGFWVLFWAVLGVSCIRVLLVNIITTGRPLNTRVLSLLRKDLFKVALTDLAMYLMMYVTFGLQKLVARNWLNYPRYGWILQHIWQSCFLWGSVTFARKQKFDWIAQIFLVLHALTMLMQQYSYAAYNAHLHSITDELNTCKLLQKIEEEHGLTDDTSERDIEIQERIEFCDKELKLQSSTIRYPDNLTVSNFFWFTMFPTVIYQLEYPRTDRIRWGFAFKKIAGIFGIFFMLILQAEQHLYPLVVQAKGLRAVPLTTRFREYPGLFLDMIPPFVICYLLVFYLIWDAVMNSLAEVTRFGDREFYRDWWNSSHWDKFARDWNVPVHNFLLRHVYFSSISTLKLSKSQAMFLTFFFSSVVHELLMYVIFDKVRGYLFVMQLSQLPLEMLCKTKFMRARPVLGIVSFWLGICLGPSILCSLYLTF